MGRLIGKYEIGAKLGAGNFSIVKLCTDIETGVQYAVKIMAKGQTQWERYQLREIATMKRLNHPNVLRLREVLDGPEHLFLILELVTGGDLCEAVKRAPEGRLTEATARVYFQQLIAGLNHCHQNGIAHRDLKLENIMLDGSGIVKITDFGLCNFQEVNQEYHLHTVCGTPEYVAPEVLSNQRGYNGFKADLWSCGVILYAMLAGYLPFSDPNQNRLFRKIETGDYYISRKFGDEVKDLITNLLQVDPRRRLTMQEVMAHPWFKVGWDPRMLNPSQGGADVVTLSEEDVNGAVMNAPSAKTDDEESASMPTGGKPKAGQPVATGMDAFDLISRLSNGKLNPFVAERGCVIPKCCCRFIFRGTGEDLLKGLRQINGTPKVQEDNPNEIKGFINFPKGMVVYNVSWIPTVTPGVLFVEIRRSRGSQEDVQEAMKAILQNFSRGIRGRPMISFWS